TLRTRRPMYAVEFEGRRYDTGDKFGFLKATVEFALARPDLATEFRASLKPPPLYPPGPSPRSTAPKPSKNRPARPREGEGGVVGVDGTRSRHACDRRFADRKS